MRGLLVLEGKELAPAQGPIKHYFSAGHGDISMDFGYQQKQRRQGSAKREIMHDLFN